MFAGFTGFRTEPDPRGSGAFRSHSRSRSRIGTVRTSGPSVRTADRHALSTYAAPGVPVRLSPVPTLRFSVSSPSTTSGYPATSPLPLPSSFVIVLQDRLSFSPLPAVPPLVLLFAPTYLETFLGPLLAAL